MCGTSFSNRIQYLYTYYCMFLWNKQRFKGEFDIEYKVINDSISKMSKFTNLQLYEVENSVDEEILKKWCCMIENGQKINKYLGFRREKILLNFRDYLSSRDNIIKANKKEIDRREKRLELIIPERQLLERKLSLISEDTYDDY